MTHNELSHLIIEISIYIHRRLGPGLLESVYHKILEHELRKRGLRVESEVPIAVVWDGERIDIGFRADVLVEDMVLVELKSTEKVPPVQKKIFLTYLRLMDKRLGLMLNFGEETLRDGIHRVVNGLDE